VIRASRNPRLLRVAPGHEQPFAPAAAPVSSEEGAALTAPSKITKEDPERSSRFGVIGTQKLSVADRIWVRATAEIIRAVVLRKVVDDADRIAERVVEKLREAPMAEPEALFISVEEAARLLGITRAAVDKRIQRRQVPGVVRTAGRRVQIDRARFLAGLTKRGR